MGQILKQDKIGSLSEAGGTITLQPSTLTIGGQQYSTASLNVAADVGSANTRYQIYAIRSAGNTVLTISTNENSVGPAGFSAWKLVGSYMTNDKDTFGFGSFINIEGIPTTDLMAFDFRPVSGWSALTRSQRGGTYQRKGNMLIVPRINMSPTTSPTGDPIRTNHVGGMTGSVEPGTNEVMQFIGEIGSSIGRELWIITTNSNPERYGFAETNSNILVEIAQSSYGASGQAFFGKYQVAVDEWSNTPIKDL